MTKPCPVVALTDCVREEAEMYAKALTFYRLRVEPIVTVDPEVAAAAISRLAPDAVLTRLLPGSFGLELIRLLRASSDLGELPIIVITTSIQPAVHEHARAAGASEVVLLPSTPDEIAAVVRRRLRAGRQRQHRTG